MDVQKAQTILDGSELRVLVAQRSVLDSKWFQPAEKADPHGRLYHVESGRAWASMRGERVELSPGRLCLIPTDTPFAYGCQKRVVINWTHFTFTTCDGVDFFRIARCPFWLDTDEGTRIMELHQRLRSFADEASLRGEFERRSCVMSLLSSFIARAVVGGGFAGRAYERLRPVLERIERDPSRGVELDELAHAAGMAPSSFSRLFKKCMGVGPVRYALGRRIQFARRLLRQTDRKLEDIASELGFTDAFHLSKTFKLLTGTSPSDYRRQAAAPIP